MIKEEELHEIGMFAKPHGVKGEISLITDYDLSCLTGDLHLVCSIDNIYVPFFVDSFRYKSASNTIVKFENLDSEDKVKILTRKPAFVPSGLLPLHDDDRTVHQKTLSGYNVVDDRTFRRKKLNGYTIVDDRYGMIGTVTDLDDSTPNILLKVDSKGVEMLIPLSLVTSIEHLHQTMNISLPEGFLELYTPTNETAK